MAKLNSLEDLYAEHVQDLYSAETQLTKALPKMAKAVSSPELQQAFQMHLEQTKQHATRLEHIATMINIKPTGKTCQAMKGLIAEADELLSERADASVLDAGLIADAQRVEHYEIAGYGTLRTWAQMLGYEEAVALIEQTLQEEKQADDTLTQLAERVINIKAAQA